MIKTGTAYKMEMRPTVKICYTAVMTAVAVLLPQAFHIFGEQAGSIFLPMHIPVLMAGMLLGAYSGLAVGIIAPVLSCLIFAMPLPLKLPFMVVELAFYGLVSGLLAHRMKSLYITLIGAMIGGRVAYTLAILFAKYVLAVKIPAAFGIIPVITTGFVGIIIQLAILPPAVFALRKVMKKSQTVKMNKEYYKEILEKHSLAVISNGKSIFYNENGIKPLLIHLKTATFGNCVIADRVIGKAAAMLMVYGGAKAVYTDVISVYAAEVFDKHGVNYDFASKVDYIVNRSKTGMCPMEQLCLDIDDVKEAYEKLSEKVGIN